jgi:hypothetical protein
MDHRQPRPLPDSLASLGIEELQERLEISPLLADDGVFDQEIDNCCSCKIPPRPDQPDSPGGGED